MKTKILCTFILFFSINIFSLVKGIQPKFNSYNELYSKHDDRLINYYEMVIPKIDAIIYTQLNKHLSLGLASMNLLHIDSSEIFQSSENNFRKNNVIEKEESIAIESWMIDFNLKSRQNFNLQSDDSDNEDKIVLEDWMYNNKSWLNATIHL